MINLPDEHSEHQLPKLPNSVTAQDMKESLNIPMFQEEAECAASAFNQCLMECQPVYDAAKRIKGALDECLKEIDAMQESINYKYKTLIKWRKRAIELETEVQRLNATAQPVSDGWIKCSDRIPQNEPGLWSTPVAAVSDLGDVFQLSCMDGYWQRTKDFVESGASEIVYWMYLPISLDKNLTE